MDTSYNGHPPMERRSFLKWATHGLGALFGVILGVPAIAYVSDARHRTAKTSDFRTVAKLRHLKVGDPARPRARLLGATRATRTMQFRAMASAAERLVGPACRAGPGQKSRSASGTYKQRICRVHQDARLARPPDRLPQADRRAADRA